MYILNDEYQICKYQLTSTNGTLISTLHSGISCEQFGIEPQVAAKFLSKPIIQKIKIEGQELNLLPKTSKLPL
jgi:hypothetical protein